MGELTIGDFDQGKLHGETSSIAFMIHLKEKRTRDVKKTKISGGSLQLHMLLKIVGQVGCRLVKVWKQESGNSYSNVMSALEVYWLTFLPSDMFDIDSGRFHTWRDNAPGILETTEYMLLSASFHYRDIHTSLTHHYFINTQGAQDNYILPCCLQIPHLLQHIILPDCAQQHLKSVRR